MTMEQSGVIDPKLVDVLLDYPILVLPPSRRAEESALAKSRNEQICLCKFCGRACKNAQALGGHMNVHRREKALASQLVELRNQGANDVGNENNNNNINNSNDYGDHQAKIGSGSAVTVAVDPAGDVDVLSYGYGFGYGEDHAWDMQRTSSPPSSSSSTKSPLFPLNCIVHPRRSTYPKLKHVDSVDLELRLGCSSLQRSM